jgi:hypothetical protein
MSSDNYSDEDLQLALDIYTAICSHRKAASIQNVGKSTSVRRVAAAHRRGLVAKPLDGEDLSSYVFEEPPQRLSEHPNVKIEDQHEDVGRVVTGKGIKTLEGLLKEAKVDLTEWVVTKKVINKWDGMGKGGDPVPLWQVKAWLARRPSFFVKEVKPISPVAKRPLRSEQAQEVALIIPDSQHGYRRRRDGSLEPLHDRLACDLALQAAEFLNPDKIILLGDMLDLAPWSTKFSTDPALRFTTQASLVELHWWISSMRSACPDAEIVYMEGNHEHRILRAITDNADEIVHLRPANDLEGAPALSVERLLGLDGLAVDYHGPYGASYWLWDQVRIHHGNVVRPKGGATVTAMLNNSAHSQIVGHIHRREYACKTIQGSGGNKIIEAMSPGCLCRLDGAVPHAAGSSVLDWQQGLGVVYKNVDMVHMNVLPIVNNQMVIHGKVFIGEDRIGELKKSSGLPF